MAEQSNSARNLLLTGVVLGLAAGGLGVYTMMSGKVEKPFTELSAAPVKEDALVGDSKKIMEALSRDHSLTDIAPEGATINGKPRFAPLFYSPELWQVVRDAEGKNIIVDIYDADAPALHGKVPNSWFISYGLQPVMARANALDVDADGDGFSNREEFDAKTNPNDINDFPPLVQPGREPKMVVTSVTKDEFTIRLDAGFAYETNPAEAKFKFYKNANDVREFYKPEKGIKVGESFGKTKDSKRFTVVAFVRESYSDASGRSVEESAVRLRDNEALGLEKEFVIRAGSTRADAKDVTAANMKGRRIKDEAAVLRVTAGPKANTKEGTITVPLLGEFKVPGYESVTCTLESIDAAKSANIRPKGAEVPVSVPYKP